MRNAAAAIALRVLCRKYRLILPAPVVALAVLPLVLHEASAQPGPTPVWHYPAVMWPASLTVAADTNPVLIGPSSGTIVSVRYATGGTSPSFTFSVQIGGVNVTGCSAITVTSATPASANCTAANTFTAGQQVTVVVSSVSGTPNQAMVQLTWR